METYIQSKKNNKLRVGHAPTNRDVKGTELIINALDNIYELKVMNLNLF